MFVLLISRFMLAHLSVYVICILSGYCDSYVSYGSPAEKLGILVGDVINCFNGERISTTVELENMLLSKCEDENNSLNSEVNVKVSFFYDFLYTYYSCYDFLYRPKVVGPFPGPCASGSYMHQLDVFHIRKSRWSDRTLTVKVSDDGEVVATGVTYPFGEGTP
ncbi:hypothetical protein VPH35_123746 [Triticum aestivum]